MAATDSMHAYGGACAWLDCMPSVQIVQSVSEAPSVHGTYPCATYGPSVATLQMAVLSMLRVRPELLRNDTCTYMYTSDDHPSSFIYELQMDYTTSSSCDLHNVMTLQRCS